MAFAREAAELSSFLSASRLEIITPPPLCSTAGCTYLTPGPDAAHCCAACAAAPLSHAESCARRQRRCASFACGFVCTGGAPSHCCEACGRGEGHAPTCRQLWGEGGGEEEGEEGEEEEEEEEGGGGGEDPEWVTPRLVASSLEGGGEEGEEGEGEEGEVDAMLEETIEANEEMLEAQGRQLAELLARINELEAAQ
ncbi:hypothetical protein AB1Y20_014494 [Prymnesium parvum]|uniref:TNFR-Cys domain-containing protein n=1 Tax=Prymnesium parvum TaxID=97485 RepID=A0AB34IAV0_PRYPA